jgi:hypothetical protein
VPASSLRIRARRCAPGSFLGLMAPVLNPTTTSPVSSSSVVPVALGRLGASVWDAAEIRRAGVKARRQETKCAYFDEQPNLSRDVTSTSAAAGGLAWTAASIRTLRKSITCFTIIFGGS